MNGDTALILAAKEGHVKAVELLRKPAVALHHLYSPPHFKAFLWLTSSDLFSSEGDVSGEQAEQVSLMRARIFTHACVNCARMYVFFGGKYACIRSIKHNTKACSQTHTNYTQVRDVVLTQACIPLCKLNIDMVSINASLRLDRLLLGLKGEDASAQTSGETTSDSSRSLTN